MVIRYKKNIDEIFTEKIQNILLTKNIAVIGCGGQGGYILEFLARLGVKSISFWDGDIYDKSNLNRQIECLTTTLGQNKAKVLEERLKLINNTIELYCYDWYFGEQENDLNTLLNADFIFFSADCYYNVEKMRDMLRQAIISGIPVVDCPVNLLGGYVHIETQKDLGHFDFVTHNLIKQSQDFQCENIASQTAYKCALIAAEAVNQMVQFFSNSRYACIDTTLNIDIYHHRYSQSDQFGEF